MEHKEKKFINVCANDVDLDTDEEKEALKKENEENKDMFTNFSRFPENEQHIFEKGGPTGRSRGRPSAVHPCTARSPFRIPSVVHFPTVTAANIPHTMAAYTQLKGGAYRCQIIHQYKVSKYAASSQGTIQKNRS